ncbi:hypothetical protein JCM10213v2_005337 [Rhodosporidiobolus nylandii]
MCRWIAYFSEEPILITDVIERPEHSLIKQIDLHYLPEIQHPAADSGVGAQNALTNVDGWGLAWYSDIQAKYRTEDEVDETGATHRVHLPALMPTVLKSTMPPLHDLNLRSVAKTTESSVVFGHIRATVGSPVSIPNCHPFQWGRYILMHNGGSLVRLRTFSHSVSPSWPFPSFLHFGPYARQWHWLTRGGRAGAVDNFFDAQDAIREELTKAARMNIQGTTDTETVAALFFTRLYGHSNESWLEPRPLDEWIRALRETVGILIELCEPRDSARRPKGWLKSDQNPRSWISLNLAISDGEKFVALRYAYPPQREAPSLYWSSVGGVALDRRYKRHPSYPSPFRDVGNLRDSHHLPHVVVASEPMTKNPKDQWELLGDGQLLVVEKKELADVAASSTHAQRLNREWWKPRIVRFEPESAKERAARFRAASHLDADGLSELRRELKESRSEPAILPRANTHHPLSRRHSAAARSSSAFSSDEEGHNPQAVLPRVLGGR